MEVLPVVWNHLHFCELSMLLLLCSKLPLCNKFFVSVWQRTAVIEPGEDNEGGGCSGKDYQPANPEAQPTVMEAGDNDVNKLTSPGEADDFNIVSFVHLSVEKLGTSLHFLLYWYFCYFSFKI